MTMRLVGASALATITPTAGCWTSPPPTSVENRAEPVVVEKRACPRGRVSGVLYDRHLDDEPLIGATVVVSRKGVDLEDKEAVTITDESGSFVLRRRKDMDTITVYYSDTMFEGPIPEEACKLVGRLPVGAGASGERVPLVFEPPSRKR